MGKFTKHIIAIILLGTLIPLAVALILSALYNSYSLRKETISLQQQRLSYVAQHINEQFAAISDSLQVFSQQAEVQEIFESNQLTSQQDIEAALADLCYIYPSYSNAYICSVVNQSVYSAYPETNGVVTYDELIASNWYDDITRHYEYTVTTYPFSQGDYIACVQPHRDPISLAFEGYYMAKINTSVFENAFSVFSNTRDTASLHYMTLNGDYFGTQTAIKGIDYPEIAALIASHPNEHTIFYNGQIICWKTLEQADLLIFSIFPGSTWIISSLLPSMISIMLAVVCIIIGLSIITSHLRQFLQPINHLAEAMQSADLNHLAPIMLSPRDDEVAILERRYNDMIANFKHLLDKEYKTSLAAQNATIQALQFQINPHFVNNTLQLIGSIAIEHGAMDVYELLQGFSRMFYYCLKFKGNIVCLQDELDYLKNYLTIQDKRYPGQFEISMQVVEQTLPYKLPKMTLQPIVENCFSHAFRQTPPPWRICISAFPEEPPGQDVILTIDDNGCGLDSQSLDALRTQIQQANSTSDFNYSGSIGLRNVNSRMRLLYGDQYQILVDSAQGEGTRVTLRIPPQKEEEPNDNINDCR